MMGCFDNFFFHSSQFYPQQKIFTWNQILKKYHLSDEWGELRNENIFPPQNSEKCKKNCQNAQSRTIHFLQVLEIKLFIFNTKIRVIFSFIIDWVPVSFHRSSMYRATLRVLGWRIGETFILGLSGCSE